MFEIGCREFVMGNVQFVKAIAVDCLVPNKQKQKMVEAGFN